jgi:hypothetical protein
MKKLLLALFAFVACHAFAQAAPADVALSAAAGQQVTITVSADSRNSAGDAIPMTVQWFFQNAGGTAQPIPNANASVLVLANVQPSFSGTYMAKLTNAGGSTSSPNAVVTVAAPPPAPVRPVVTGFSATVK